MTPQGPESKIGTQTLRASANPEGCVKYVHEPENLHILASTHAARREKEHVAEATTSVANPASPTKH